MLLHSTTPTAIKSSLDHSIRRVNCGMQKLDNYTTHTVVTQQRLFACLSTLMVRVDVLPSKTVLYRLSAKFNMYLIASLFELNLPWTHSFTSSPFAWHSTSAHLSTILLPSSKRITDQLTNWRTHLPLTLLLHPSSRYDDCNRQHGQHCSSLGCGDWRVPAHAAGSHRWNRIAGLRHAGAADNHRLVSQSNSQKSQFRDIEI